MKISYVQFSFELKSDGQGRFSKYLQFNLHVKSTLQRKTDWPPGRT